MAGTYSLTVTDGGCTSDPAITSVVVNTRPTASASSNSPVCEGVTIVLTGGPSGMSYSWTGPDNFTSTDQSPTIPSATSAMAGTYSLTVTNDGCSSDPATTSVVINAKPTATADSNSPVCEGNTIVLTGGPGAMDSYSWSGPDSFSSSLQSPSIPSATTAMAGTYSLTVTDGACNSDPATTSVVVNTKPTATASNSGPVAEGEAVQLFGGPDAMALYSWSGPNFFTSSEQNPIVSPAVAGTYTLTVTDYSGCSDTDSTVVVVITLPAVTTNAATDVTTNSATLNGDLTSMGTASSVDVYFEYGLTISYGSQTTSQSVGSTGTFSAPISSLTPETTYHFRAKAVDHGTAYGADMQFTTIPPQPPNQPPNVSPIPGAPCVSLPVILQSSPFSDPDPGDTHAASRWQVTTSAGSYGIPVFDSGTDTYNLTSITLSTNELDYETDYYWRLRHQDDRDAWSGWSAETYFRTADTPVGSDVTVIRDGENINYTQVTEDGCTYVTKTNQNPADPIPSSIQRVGLFVDITTTATHAGPITVGLQYDESGVPDESNLRIFHWSGTDWEDITTCVDTANNTVYGEVPSLSWFFIGGQRVWVPSTRAVPAFPSVYAGIAAALGVGIVAYFTRRRLIDQEYRISAE